MTNRIDIGTKNGRQLEFSRGLNLELLERVNNRDMVMLNLLHEDCMNIINYTYDYRRIEDDRFALYFGNITLEIFVTKDKWVVTNIVHTFEVK